MYILNIIHNIYGLLNKEQKTKMLLLQLFFAFSALVQVVGVASIAPFIGIISNPETIHSNKLLSFFYDLGEFTSDQSFIIGFAAISIFMIFISNAVSALTLWLQIKFSIYLGSNLQFKLYNSFINRDYLFHKSTNYNKLISIISSDAPRFIYMVLQPYFIFCSQALIAIIILFGLLFLDPVIAIASAIIIGGAYLLTYWFIKKSLNHHGKEITEKHRQVQALLSESLIGIKDIKLNAMEKKYTDVYGTITKKGLESNAYIILSSDLPRFVIETISFSSILVFAILLLENNSDSGSIVSVLSIYALAGYKLLPTMQQMYKSISTISANGSVVMELKSCLNEPVMAPQSEVIEAMDNVNKVRLENISYQYPSSLKPVINKLSIEFLCGNLNTIAGPSGSGKSTLADIILGLLPPTSGTLYVNEKTLDDKSMRSYQRSIGYVPQTIFILDDSVAANVAFGIKKSDVDLEKVKRALVQANAMEFVEKLPHGLDTQLGQDGKLLSGGQRQRIGIARTLYRNNKILILDEPTSALDIESEHDLMSLLNQLKKDILIIVISHRPAAIKLSDKIAVLADGNLLANGDYSELYSSNEYFRSLIEKGFMN